MFVTAVRQFQWTNINIIVCLVTVDKCRDWGYGETSSSMHRAWEPTRKRTWEQGGPAQWRSATTDWRHHCKVQRTYQVHWRWQNDGNPLVAICGLVSVKGKVTATRCEGISQFYLHIHVYQQMEWTIPAFAFLAEAGTHLQTPEGREGWVGLGNQNGE